MSTKCFREISGMDVHMICKTSGLCKSTAIVAVHQGGMRLIKHLHSNTKTISDIGTWASRLALSFMRPSYED